MKRLLTCISILASLSAVGCSSAPIPHETTTLDRELALKIADRSSMTVVQTPAPVVNVNIGGGASTSHDGYPTKSENPCHWSPVYNIRTGTSDTYQRVCWGSEHDD